jgi:hypothetical protein
MMGQAGRFLRKTVDGYSHWCPACGETHHIWTEGRGLYNWQFSGDLERPTFAPSVKITGKQTVIDERGEWTGGWVYGPDGKALDLVCHYFVTMGTLRFCGDCTHALAGQDVPLPELPEWLQDKLS